MATHSSILAWRIPWTEDPGALQSMVSQRVRHNCTTNTFSFLPSAHTHTHTHQNQWDAITSVFIPIPKKGNAEECSNYCTTALISHTNKIMLKILQVRLQEYLNHEIPDVQARFRKGRGNRDQSASIRWIIGKQGNSRKTSTSALLVASLVAQMVKHLPARWETRV